MDTRSAMGLDCFEKFASAKTCESILNHFSNLCEILQTKRTVILEFLAVLKENLTSYDLRDLLAKYEQRISSKVYNHGRACASSTVLIIGAGPCGLRAAIECQLLGARVIVLEKRHGFTRNNVLHLWPFVMHDLRGLGAKRFCPKFCSGTIDHVSIAQLQCILVKVALTLGVEVFTGVEFSNLIEPTVRNPSWTVATTAPPGHPIHSLKVDVILGADGKQNVLPGFRRKELRAKLAIAITANFLNKRTAAEIKVQEISGVSSIFRQALFQNLADETGIDLENIVYYKDDTHYFVMTAKKQSLLAKGVLKDNFSETSDLLAPENIDIQALESYTIEAVQFVTEDGLPNLEFALNPQGNPDLSIFDFTKMYAAENSCRVKERHGSRLLMGLVGDSLLEPFWPTGSGCARGFLSALDASWMIRSWARGEDVLDVMAERETIYRLLAQTTHDNLSKDYKSYTVDPTTRYPNLVPGTVQPCNVTGLYDSDVEIASCELHLIGRGQKVEKSPVRCHVSNPLEPCKINKSPSPGRKTEISQGDTYSSTSRRSEHLKVKRPPSPRASKENFSNARTTDSQPRDIDFLVDWLRMTLDPYGIQVSGIHDIFVRGDVLCGLIHVFRPDLIPQYPFPPEIEEGIDVSDLAAFRNQIAFDFLNNEYSLPYIVSGYNSVQYTMTQLHDLIHYLFQVYDIFGRTWSEKNMCQTPRRKIVRSATFSARDINHQSQEFEKPNRSGRCVRNLQARFQSLQFKPAETIERRSLRRQDSEKCKLKAMKFMSSIQARRSEAEQEETEARRDRIIKTIRSVHGTGTEAPSGSTKAKDDFFNEYNIRLWRQSVPTMEERAGKLQTALAAPLPGSKQTEGKKMLKKVKSCAALVPPGAVPRVTTKDWVLKVLAQKFPDAPPPPIGETLANQDLSTGRRSAKQENCETEEDLRRNVNIYHPTPAHGGGVDTKFEPDYIAVTEIPERACYIANENLTDKKSESEPKLLQFDEEDEDLLQLLGADELEDLESWSGKYL